MASFPFQNGGSSWKEEGPNRGMYWIRMWNLDTIRLAVWPVDSRLENKETYENNSITYHHD